MYPSGEDEASALEAASAAGAAAVATKGALPSLPTREARDAILARLRGGADGLRGFADGLRGGADGLLRGGADGLRGTADGLLHGGADACARLRGGADACPWRFASRLNSMKDRRDLAGDLPNDPLGWVRRQGEIEGLDFVDFNYPEHLGGLEETDVKEALSEAGLRCGAVCLRYLPRRPRLVGSGSRPRRGSSFDESRAATRIVL